MADQSDVRRIAKTLPGTTEGAGRFGFSVRNKSKDKGFVWSWMERIHPKKARVESDQVIAIRVASELEKQMLLSSDEETFFTEPHYNGYPAVLVRLEAISVGELEAVLTAAWRCQAPKDLIAELDARPKRPRRKPAARKPRRR